MPLCFEDVLSARILSRDFGDQRDLLLAGLDAIEDGFTQSSLLAHLVSCDVLSSEQARRVHEQVSQYKQTRAVHIYAHLLVRLGIAVQHVQTIIRSQGAGSDPNALGEALVAANVVSADWEQAVRYRARMIFDKDLANQVQVYRMARQGTEDQAPVIDTQLSQVIRLQLPESNVQIETEVNAQAAVKQILSEISLDPHERPPQFPIPDWVDTADAKAGKRLAGYRVLGRIGAGAMGVVYLADQPDEPERPVALKLLLGEMSDEARGRFKREILATSLFSHPGILDIYDAGETADGNPYLAMEFFDGEDLAEILQTEKKFSLRRSLVLMRQLFEALNAAHEAGVVHRDVKPDNILVTLDGQKAKLMDFGIALIPGLDEQFKQAIFHTQVRELIGTPRYMSPEQASGDTPSTPSDDYSMGLVLYEMLAGRLPFESESPTGFISCHLIEDPLPLREALPESKDYPDTLHSLLDRLFDKDPGKRPATRQVVTMLNLILQEIEVQSIDLERSGKWLLGSMGKRRG